MNQHASIDDQALEWMPAADAAALLGIKRETLYAYASRGRIRSVAGSGADRARLYCREDLERQRARSRARSGHGPVAASALRWGEPVLETRVGTIDATGPVYRGRSAIDLVRAGASFESVAALLWDGAFAPPEAPRLGVHVRALAELVGPRAGPFDAMSVAAAALAAAEPRGEGPSVAKQRAGTLVRRLVASCALPRGAEAVAAALAAGAPASSRAGLAPSGARRSGRRARSAPREAPAAPANATARSLLVALGARTTRASVEAMNVALVLCADHELNASTFAARVAASSGASLTASIVAALAALSGPLHGAATARVEALVAEIERPERAAEVVAARLGRGEAIPGYGHPLYPDGDPRGAHLLEIAGRLSSKARAVRVLVAVTNAMHLVAREAPTVDVGLAALASALGLRRGAAIAVFACGRLAGWIAHALEQREGGHLLRPRARYVGA